MEPTVNKNLEETNIDVSLPKVAAVGALGALSALGTGYFLYAFLNSTDASLAALLLFVFLFTVIFLLQTLFVKSAMIGNILLLVEGTLMTVPFLLKFSWYLLVGWLAILFFLWLGARRGRQEMDNQMKVHFFRIERRTLKQIFTGLALFISLMYVNVNGADNLGISKKQIQSLLQPAEPLAQRLVISNFSVNMSVYQLADAIVTQQLKDQLGAGAGPAIAAAKTAAIEATLAGLRSQAAPYGLTFKNSDTLPDILYNYIVGKAVKIPPAFRLAIPISLALILFVTIKGIAVLVRWPVAILSYIIYELLLAIGFARITLESRSREIILL